MAGLEDLYNSGIGDEKDKYRMAKILSSASSLLEGEPSGLDKINTAQPTADQTSIVPASNLDKLSNAPAPTPGTPNLDTTISGDLSLGKTPPPAPNLPASSSGVLAGLKEGALGMPETVGEGTSGRNTAYWMGRLLPDIVRSKLGVPTATEQKYYQSRMTKEEKEAAALNKIAREEEKTSKTQTNKDRIFSTNLRNTFSNRPEVKDYVYVAANVKSMESLLAKAKMKGQAGYENKVALDQGLITMFNKLTDPNSVVRESEYARTPQNLPLVNRFTGAMLKVQQGGAGLTDKDREALVWGAQVILKERGAAHDATREYYSQLATEYGLDPDLVVGRATPPTSEIGTKTGSTQKSTSTDSKLSNDEAWKKYQAIQRSKK